MRKPRPSFLKNLFGLRIFLVINLVILFFLALSFGKEFMRNYDIQKEINELQARADDLESRNSEIAKLSTVIQTEFFVEREARLKLGLSKPGEKVVIIEGVQELTDRGAERTGDVIDHINQFTSDDEAVDLKSINNVTLWWYYFFNKPRFDQLNEIM